MIKSESLYLIMSLFSNYFIGMTLMSTLWQLPSFHNYSRVYKMLPHLKFYRDERSVWAILPSKKLEVFIWNFKTDGFCLGRNSVLVNSVATCFCPYSFYWLIKYQRWIRKNINLSELKEFKEDDF